MRVYLTGFMGCGKSTVGRILAADLGYRFVDLDEEIERATGKAVAQIIHEDGEPAFRKAETLQLQSIQSTNTVVSTGGGCFIFNRDWMLQNGTVVYLRVPFDALAARIGADPSRPLWRNAEQLFRDREPLYEAAHITIDASLAAEDAAAEIRNRFKPL